MSTKRYLHDRIILLLLSLNSFFVLLGGLLVLLRLGGEKTSVYIVQYRSNLGLSGPKPGGSTDLLAFVVFNALIFGLCLAISIKIYNERRYAALASLALCLLLLIMSIVVSNALLGLR